MTSGSAPHPSFWSRLVRLHTLRGQLLGLISLVLLFTLLVIGTGVSYFVFRTEREAWQGRQLEASRHAASTFEEFFQLIQEWLDVVGTLDHEYLASYP
ncbi:MAG: hypothetical protein H0T73_03590, partial [Ardenticatenales bacterium]|nr:hypothetical protein [Ardenticatenales bacterium]